MTEEYENYDAMQEAARKLLDSWEQDEVSTSFGGEETDHRPEDGGHPGPSDTSRIVDE